MGLSRRLMTVGMLMGSAILSSGCATVAVLESAVESELALTKPQSELYKASVDFCESSRAYKWASGESNFSSLMKIWGGDVETGEAYWEYLTTFDPTQAELVEQIGYDVQSAQDQLNDINTLAQKLLPSHGAEVKPRQSDVKEFERVLIHAGQARESFKAAFERLEGEARLSPGEVTIALYSFDKEIKLARDIANGLASARMSEALAKLDDQTS